MIGRFVRQVFNLMKLNDSELILDLGCGEGYIMKALKEKNKDLKFIGVDLDLRSISIARQRNPSFLFVQADILKLPFKDNAFSVIICLETLEHIAGEPEEALKEIKRISNDLIIISVPNEPFFSLANLFMGRRLKYFGNDPEHRHAWGKDAFLNLSGKFFKVLAFKLSFPWTIVLLQK